MSSGAPWHTHRDSVSFAGNFTFSIIGEIDKETEMTVVISPIALIDPLVARIAKRQREQRHKEKKTDSR
jgi:hypothetical protein